jgi:ABC-type bacteriocin/lantibiotic exporter with double-glycine peptidase domain
MSSQTQHSQLLRQQRSIDVQLSIGAMAETLEARDLDAIFALGQDDKRQLILYLQRYFGSGGKNNIVTDKDSLESLLEANNFHFRKAPLNTNPRFEQVPVVAKNHAAGLVVLTQIRGKRLVFDLADETVVPLQAYDQELLPMGYEIYEVFPQELDSLWKLSQFLLPTIRGDLLVALGFSLVLVVLSLASPVLTSQVVGDVVPSGNVQWMLSAFVVSLLLTGFNTVLSWIQSFYLLRLNRKLSLRIQLSVFDRILKVPVSFIKGYSVGDLSSRAGAINNLANLLSSTTLSSVINSVAILGYIALMFFYDFMMALVALAFTLVSAVIQVLLARRQLFYERESQVVDAELLNFSLETLGALPQIRSNACEPFILDRWFASVMRTTGLQFRQAQISSVSSAASTMLGSVGTTLMYAVLIVRMLMAKDLNAVALTTSTFLVFFSAYNGFSSRFMQLVNLFNTLLGSALIQVERAMPILKEKAEPGYAIGKAEHVITGQISLRGVSFAYPDTSEDIFTDLSCDIKPGSFNALFGPSGCGKSTIFKLILGFYRPRSGSIFIDSLELDDLSVAYYRRQLGVILQKPVLPPGSIRDAVSSGLDIDVDEIWKALEFANVAAEVDALPMKLETVLSEGALNISGGQRQRISIARAILHKPRVLMEDEATSALDNDSQRIIGDNLRNAGITRIVIAHRLSAVQQCDHMIVINHRRVESQGTYEHCKKHSDYLKSVLAEL